MGVVYKAFDPELKRYAAIKVMLPSVEIDEELRIRFRREAQSVARLNHPNIVSIYDVGQQDNCPFIAMEYVEGEDLTTLIKKKVFIPFAKKIDLIIQTSDGLHYAHHKGIVHRDIKPGNIRLSRDGRAKILDFGIALIESSEITRPGTVMGAPYYMSPELVKGARDVDGRSDVFSLGVVLYELISYRKPFDADTPTAVCFQIVADPHSSLVQTLPGCSKRLVEIVDRALAKQREQRFANCGEMASALEEFKHELPEAEQVLRPTVQSLQEEFEKVRAECGDISIPGMFESTLLALEELDGDPTDYGNLLRRRRHLEQRLRVIAENREKIRPLLQLLTRSRRQFEKGELEACTETLEEVLRLHPENAEAKQRNLECRRMLDERRREQERRLRVDAALGLAREALDQGNFERCLRAARTALKISPQHSGALELERSATEAIERRKRAEKLFEAAKRYYEHEDFESSYQATKEALELEPEHSELKALHERAKHALEKRQEVNSLFEKARRHFESGDYKRALSALESLLAIQHSHPEGLKLQRSVLEALQRQEKVEELLKMAQRHYEAEEYEACYQVTEEALNLDSKHTQLNELHYRGLRAIEETRNKIEVTLQKVRKLLGASDYQAALEAVEEALGLEPENLEANRLKQSALKELERQRKIAELLTAAQGAEEDGNYEKCLEIAEKGLKLDPDHPELKELSERARRALESRQVNLLEFIQNEIKEKRFNSALGNLAFLLELDPNHAEALRLKKEAEAGLRMETAQPPLPPRPTPPPQVDAKVPQERVPTFAVPAQPESSRRLWVFFGVVVILLAGLYLFLNPDLNLPRPEPSPTTDEPSAPIPEPSPPIPDEPSAPIPEPSPPIPEPSPPIPEPSPPTTAQQQLTRFDDEAFDDAWAQGTIPALQAYLDKYRDGRHRVQARNLLQALEIMRYDNEAFQIARQHNTPAEYRQYLQQFNFRHLVAIQRYDSDQTNISRQWWFGVISEHLLLLDNRAFQSTQQIDTVEAYRDYFEKYSNGRHVAQAQARTSELVDLRDWENAQQAATPEAYQRYLRRHPNGKYAAAARDVIKVKDLVELDNQDFQTARGQRTLEAYQNHLDRFQRCTHREQVLRLIVGLDDRDFQTARQQHSFEAYQNHLDRFKNCRHQPQARRYMDDLRVPVLIQTAQQGQRLIRVSDPTKIDPKQEILLRSSDGRTQEIHYVEAFDGQDIILTAPVDTTFGARTLVIQDPSAVGEAKAAGVPVVGARSGLSGAAEDLLQ
ncbi:protein kinase [Acidobacteria bacterium AH-259-G07]|nr:protein kinase [Acidobacteria bacterium AH-259-G07]